MCGIAGIVQLHDDGPVSLDTLNRMIQVQRYRGPDETGIYIDDRVGLGHARLSIIDLAGGSQPIHNEDESIYITFNGEIYNYIELRQNLEKKGHRFATDSDTEVIVHQYEEDGIACLDKLNGQFAFAVWDKNQCSLLLARDRVGIRPLYYTQAGSALIFASEIKALFMDDRVRRELDPIALTQVFTFWTTLPGTTPFKGIYELPAGQYLLIDRGGTHQGTYWELPFCPENEKPSLSLDTITERMMELLKDSIRLRLRADVPVGAYLSGGLDSSGVSAIVARHFQNDLCTFGIRFAEQAFDEGDEQQLMVAALGCNHKEIRIENHCIPDTLDDVVYHCEKPLLRTSPIPLYHLSRTVRENDLKVVLTGEGADEIFGGYNIFIENKIRRFWAKNPGSAFRHRLLEQLYPYVFKGSRMKAMMKLFFARGLQNTDSPLYSHMIRWDTTSRIRQFFSKDVKQAAGQYDPLEELTESLPRDFDARDDFAKAQYLEISIFMSNYLLSSQGDRVAMANSVEIRLPYLDHRMIEFMATVPAKWKIHGTREKYILKHAFTDILPSRIVERPKNPFRAPIGQGLVTATTKAMLERSRLQASGLFDADEVSLLMDKLYSGSRFSEIDDMALVGILSTQILQQHYIHDFNRHTPPPRMADHVIDKQTHTAMYHA